MRGMGITWASRNIEPAAKEDPLRTNYPLVPRKMTEQHGQVERESQSARQSRVQSSENGTRSGKSCKCIRRGGMAACSTTSLREFRCSGSGPQGPKCLPDTVFNETGYISHSRNISSYSDRATTW